MKRTIILAAILAGFIFLASALGPIDDKMAAQEYTKLIWLWPTWFLIIFAPLRLCQFIHKKLGSRRP